MREGEGQLVRFGHDCAQGQRVGVLRARLCTAHLHAVALQAKDCGLGFGIVGDQVVQVKRSATAQRGVALGIQFPEVQTAVCAQTVLACGVLYGNVYRRAVGIAVRTHNRNCNAVPFHCGCVRGLEGRGKRPGMGADAVEHG